MAQTLLHVQSITSTPKQLLLGITAAFITVLIWSSYALSLRIGALTSLTLIELSFFRYAIPALVLFPVFFKSLRVYAKVPFVYVVGIVLGSGLPFFFLSGLGMQLTQVAYGSTLIPGTVPLFVTLLAVFVYKQPLPSFRKLGLLGVGAGVVCMLTQASWSPDLLLGQALLLLCGFLWALFTISIRQAGLSPLQVAALAALPNGVFISLYILFVNPTLGFEAMPLSAVLGQMLVQGVIVGVFSGLCFSAAIVRLGAEKTAAIGASTPVVATFFASIFLAEQLSFSLLLGMGFVIAGVFLASGVLHKERAS